MSEGTAHDDLRRRESSPASTISATSHAAGLAQSLPAATRTGPTRIILQGDPSLHTCFSQADKELYDLWAPKA
ncbi:hypothetical protein BKA62DRAFT_690034 [Auriculariales sp. MPI-PUGE-AT-0066]|nr:hypothetical protein BKA62DRAFT_690034 [Auriculariales sp. MPI-PUGE-AT-0066]